MKGVRKKRVGNCPACGAEVEFGLSASLVTICEFCHSVVARGDRQLEEHGKVADLVQTDSPVSVGMTGEYEQRRFEVVGRVQYDHPAGGVWDEYYLKLGGDRVLWLAAAQGRLFVTRQRKPSESVALPDVEGLKPGAGLEIAGVGRLVVAESGVARARSAEGEIPWGFRPGAAHRFVDLQGPQGEFATLGQAGPDSELTLYLGRQVQLEELGLRGMGAGEEATRQPVRATGALQVNCPQCAGPLRLFAPDASLRVTCPNCDSLLECDKGNLRYLSTIPPLGHGPRIPLGTEGTLRETRYTVIGYLVRFVTVEYREYPWEEYLLLTESGGFRWLLCNQDHWAIAESITAGLEPEDGSVTWQGRNFRLFDRGTAQVKRVLGEFYWKVSVEERVRMDDYIAPPLMLSFERSETDSSSELVVTRLEYVPVEEVEEGFGVEELPRSWSVGPIQPAPEIPGEIVVICLGAIAVLVAQLVYFLASAVPVTPVYTLLAGLGVLAWPVALWLRKAQFESQRWADSPFGTHALAGVNDDEGENNAFDSD
ncbi:MAG: DUF4178 domain-containing protein [Planctomycetaceae bacterium]